MQIILQTMSKEFSSLCSTASPSLFRLCHKKQLMHLTLSDMAHEVEAKAPLVYKLLLELAQPGDSCKASSQLATTHGSIVVAVGVLLRQRNIHMNALQYILGILLWQGHTSKEVRLYACCVECYNYAPSLHYSHVYIPLCTGYLYHTHQF